jgi:hypothetical protein
MTHVFKELNEKALVIQQLVQQKNSASISPASAAFKQEFLSHVEGIKKLIATWVKNKQRQNAKKLRYEVKDTRITVEKSIRSPYLVSQADLSPARKDLIVCAKKMIKIEQALAFADDILFAGEISEAMNDAVDQAKNAVKQAKIAAEAMKQFANSKRLEGDHDSHYDTRFSR